MNGYDHYGVRHFDEVPRPGRHRLDVQEGLHATEQEWSMNGYIGTMTTADTLGMYATLLILATIAFGFLAYVYSRIRADNADMWGADLGKSDYAQLCDEQAAVAHLKQEHVTPLEFDGAPDYVPERWATPYAPLPAPAPKVGRHRRDTGAWPVVVARELVGAGAP